MDYFTSEQSQALALRGIFTVTNDITIESIEGVCQAILSYISAGTKEITLLISSEGGDVDGAMCFAEFVSLFEKVRLHGVALGECGSAALTILQCCHKRTGLRNCDFLVHPMHSWLNIVHDGTELEQAKLLIADGRKLNELLVALTCRRAGLRRSTWNKLAREGEKVNMRLTAKELLSLGMLDDIVDEYPVY